MRAYAVQLADGMRYNASHDMFSLGVIASELCTGRHLFYGYLGPEPRIGYSNFACIFEHLRIPRLTPDDEADPMLAQRFMDESASPEPSHAPGERWHVYNVYRFGWPMYEEELVDHALAAKLSARIRLKMPTYQQNPRRVLAALLRRRGFPNQKWRSALHALANLLDAMGLVVRAGVVFSLGGGDLVAARQRHVAQFAEIVTFCERVDACDRAGRLLGRSSRLRTRPAPLRAAHGPARRRHAAVRAAHADGRAPKNQPAAHRGAPPARRRLPDARLAAVRHARLALHRRAARAAEPPGRPLRPRRGLARVDRRAGRVRVARDVARALPERREAPRRARADRGGGGGALGSPLDLGFPFGFPSFPFLARLCTSIMCRVFRL